MNDCTFLILLYLVVAAFTAIVIGITSEHDSEGNLYDNSLYEMFWGSLFWPITIIVVVIKLICFCFIPILIETPHFLAGAFKWGVEQIKKNIKFKK
jgi:hypothetical protein